jgi:hypothetical protein
MLFNKNELIARARSLNKIAIANEAVAMDSLDALHESATPSKRFDIFLSHSYADRDAVKGLADMLEKDFNLSVYLDWVVDTTLDRTKVNKDTSEVLRNRLSHCKCLWYVTSEMSATSKWMPWETGFADGHCGKVAICPLVDGEKSSFNGLEYLSLYPYVDIAKASGSDKKCLWINESSEKYCSFDSWLNNNAKPTYHK